MLLSETHYGRLKSSLANDTWERGLNENTNGLIRQYILKGHDFSELTEQNIKHIENRLNQRPRKSLGYATPNEIFERER